MVQQLEPSHEKRDLRVVLFKILWTCMHSHSKGSEMWLLGGSSSSLFYDVSKQWRLMRLCWCLGSSEPFLFAFVISTFFTWMESTFFTWTDLFLFSVLKTTTTEMIPNDWTDRPGWAVSSGSMLFAIPSASFGYITLCYNHTVPTLGQFYGCLKFYFFYFYSIVYRKTPKFSDIQEIAAIIIKFE